MRQVVEQEVVGLGEAAPPVEQRDDLPLVAGDQPLVRRSSSVARRNSIPYFSPKPSTWPWPSIGRPGSVASIVATPKYLSPLPNCSTAVFSSGLFMKLT